MTAAKHFLSKDYKYSETDLGKSIQSWLSYQIALNRNYSLAESSINFPFGEYLSQYVSELELEKELKYFGSRWTDAFLNLEIRLMFPIFLSLNTLKKVLHEINLKCNVCLMI